MKSTIGMAFLTLFLAGCMTTVTKETRVQSSFNAKEYNSVLSQYLDRPTFVTLNEFSDGASALSVQMDEYGSTSSYLSFDKSRINEYLPLIDKFLAWETKATDRKDAFTKEFGRAETWGNGGRVDLKFVFYSGNESKHYLSISFCSVGICIDDKAHFYDRENTVKLKELLVSYNNNSIKQKDIDSIYQ